MANENLGPVFRDLLNDFLNEVATESVNAERHQREDRWTCSGCGRHARDRFVLAQCESSHDPEEPYVEGSMLEDDELPSVAGWTWKPGSE